MAKSVPKLHILSQPHATAHKKANKEKVTAGPWKQISLSSHLSQAWLLCPSPFRSLYNPAKNKNWITPWPKRGFKNVYLDILLQHSKFLISLQSHYVEHFACVFQLLFDRWSKIMSLVLFFFFIITRQVFLPSWEIWMSYPSLLCQKLLPITLGAKQPIKSFWPDIFPPWEVIKGRECVI